MTPERLWPVVLVALFVMPIHSLNCVLLENATLESVRLLGSIIICSPLKCLKEIKNFEFPKEVLPYIQHVERDMKEAFFIISSQALNIFFSHNSHISPVTAERLQHIRMGLYEQMLQVQDCFKDEEKESKEGDNKPEHPPPKHLQKAYLELSKYFIRIKKFLRDKKYSVCAWKIVTAEIRRCFTIFYNFKKLLRMRSEEEKK
ncbi:interferon kappa [Mesocricetus auratus]|uniref:Interferon kappa n=1 Tax=Mesocricetus auratus TaxID=10036 RepID=A0ABM2X428_MESAU|nr:interferon kappa [Mesocricetus auratus]XP_040596261.1 interferon kappa [Mesocricetus auratus]